VKWKLVAPSVKLTVAPPECDSCFTGTCKKM
jgi:hypothetical protein